jgi:hypothetical protein
MRCQDFVACHGDSSVPYGNSRRTRSISRSRGAMLSLGAGVAAELVQPFRRRLLDAANQPPRLLDVSRVVQAQASHNFGVIKDGEKNTVSVAVPFRTLHKLFEAAPQGGPQLVIAEQNISGHPSPHDNGTVLSPTPAYQNARREQCRYSPGRSRRRLPICVICNPCFSLVEQRLRRLRRFWRLGNGLRQGGTCLFLSSSAGSKRPTLSP